MSLLIYAYQRAANGDIEPLIPEEPSEYVGGFRVTRRDLWGADDMSALGMVLLPRLREVDLYIEGSELDQLAREAALMMLHSHRIADATGYLSEYVNRRARNVLLAVNRAKAIGGGVFIGTQQEAASAG